MLVKIYYYKKEVKKYILHNVIDFGHMNRLEIE